MDLLAVNEHHARTLLMHYRWDVERIFELLDQKGRDRLFSEAGVTLHKKNKSLTCTVSCLICFEEVTPHVSTEMDCGHRFCNECKFFFLFLLLFAITNTWYYNALDWCYA